MEKKRLFWKDAPDVITPNELALILGIGLENAKNMYHLSDFPKIPGSTRLIADKEAVRLWCMRVDVEGAIVQQILKHYSKTLG